MEESWKGVLQVVKAVTVSLVLSVFLVAVYALILKVLPMADTAVTIVTQVLKSIALAVGVILFIKGEKGLVKGAACGLLFSMLGYLTFAALGGGFSLSWLILLELILFVAVGGLLGVVAVNVKKG
ncbi:MAG: TIGR04086 family membrane protein [Clostridia bacterium]|nr:TIGR04086 family membrane protein [Clostridia bacterium]